MLIIKMLGIVGIVLLVLLALVLLLPIRLFITTDEQNKVKVKVQILCFAFAGKPSEGKKSSDKLQKLLLGDRFAGEDALKESTKDEGIGNTVQAALALIENVCSRVRWLLSKCRVHRLLAHITAAHEDAAVAAIEYGSLSTSVYSLGGMIDANMRVDKDALDIRVFCDFQQKKPTAVLDVRLSLRVCWAVFAVATLIYQNKKDNQYKK